MKKIAFSFFSSLFVSIIISVVVSIYMNTAFGGDINVMTFTTIVPMCTAIGTVVGSVFATIVPVGPIAVKIAHKLGAAPGSLSEILLRNMTIMAVMLFVMCFAITLITHFVFGAPYPGTIPGTPGSDSLDAFLNAWFKPIPALFAPCYVMSLIVDPLCSWLTAKICNTPPQPATAATATAQPQQQSGREPA
jgi:hypothetical protein